MPQRLKRHNNAACTLTTCDTDCFFILFSQQRAADKTTGAWTWPGTENGWELGGRHGKTKNSVQILQENLDYSLNWLLLYEMINTDILKNSIHMYLKEQGY